MIESHSDRGTMSEKPRLSCWSWKLSDIVVNIKEPCSTEFAFCPLVLFTVRGYMMLLIKQQSHIMET